MAPHDPQVVECHPCRLQQTDRLDRLFIRLRLKWSFLNDMCENVRWLDRGRFSGESGPGWIDCPNTHSMISEPDTAGWIEFPGKSAIQLFSEILKSRGPIRWVVGRMNRSSNLPAPLRQTSTQGIFLFQKGLMLLE